MKKLMENWRIFVEEEKAWESEEPEEDNYSGKYQPAWMESKVEDAVKVVLATMKLLSKEDHEIEHSYVDADELLGTSAQLSYEEYPDPETAKEYVWNLGSHTPGKDRNMLIRSPKDAVGVIIEIIVHLYHSNELVMDFSEDNYKALDDLYGLARGSEIRYEDSPEILSQFKGINKHLDAKLEQGIQR